MRGRNRPAMKHGKGPKARDLRGNITSDDYGFMYACMYMVFCGLV